jgi:3-oxoacyl-[acyl-carrier-protein] synthase-1
MTRRLGVTLTHPVRTIRGTSPALFELVREARQSLHERRVERVSIIAVDCLVDDASLKWLDQNDRLLGTRNPDGLLPGEAACSFLLESAATAARRNARALAAVLDVGLGSEKNTFASELNSSGEGLCEAIRAAARSHPSEPLKWAISDMNGESYWGYEWGIAKVRMAAMLGASELWHPADSTGCVGVAAPALAVVLASTALMRGYAPSSRALLLCASDGPERAACILSEATPRTSGDD